MDCTTSYIDVSRTNKHKALLLIQLQLLNHCSLLIIRCLPINSLGSFIFTLTNVLNKQTDLCRKDRILQKLDLKESFTAGPFWSLVHLTCYSRGNLHTLQYKVVLLGFFSTDTDFRAKLNSLFWLKTSFGKRYLYCTMKLK